MVIVAVFDIVIVFDNLIDIVFDIVSDPVTAGGNARTRWRGVRARRTFSIA